MTTVDVSFQLLACRYIEGQVKALKRQVRGARRARDIEYVHRARVASRRLRTALRMFTDCFPAGKVSKWRSQIRRLTRRLGAARDTDVQLEFLKKFISDIPHKSRKMRPGLRRIMLRLKQRRQSIQPKVVKSLDRLEEKQVFAEIAAELKAITARCRPRRGTGFQPVKSTARGLPHIRSHFVFQQAQQHIKDRLAGLFSFEHSLDDPKDCLGHHQMRIAAKRLRYTLEICNLPFANRLAEYIEAMKRLQSLLGKLHDCDVWLDDIKTFSRDEKSRMIEYLGSVRAFKRLKRGIDFLARQRRTDRLTVFEQSAQFWRKLAEQGFWTNLNSLLNSKAPSSVSRPQSDRRQAIAGKNS